MVCQYLSTSSFCFQKDSSLKFLSLVFLQYVWKFYWLQNVDNITTLLRSLTEIILAAKHNGNVPKSNTVIFSCVHGCFVSTNFRSIFLDNRLGMVLRYLYLFHRWFYVASSLFESLWTVLNRKHLFKYCEHR